MKRRLTLSLDSLKKSFSFLGESSSAQDSSELILPILDENGSPSNSQIEDILFMHNFFGVKKLEFSPKKEPNSVSFLSLSYIGQAENLTLHPLGSSLEKGNPDPPPVWSPTILT